MCVWQESCRRYCVAVKSRGIPQAERVQCPLQPPSLPASNTPGVVEEDALCAGWRSARHPGGRGWLGRVEDADRGRFHFHETGPGTVPPITPRPLKPHGEGAPVKRELCRLGLWGRQRLFPCGTWQGGQVTAYLANSRGKWHSLGQSPPPLLEHVRVAQPSCSLLSLVSCRVPGSGGQCPKLPGGPPALAFPCDWHHWGLSHPVEPRGHVSGGAAPALPQGLGRIKQVRVKGEGWCGAPAPGQPRTEPAVISVSSWSEWCHPLSPSSSWRRGAGDLRQHFGKVNAMPSPVLCLEDLLASPGSSWEAHLPQQRWCLQLPAGGQGLPPAVGGFQTAGFSSQHHYPH